MRVLVTAASKHGATDEIAQAIAASLTERGVEVTVERPDGVGSVDGYDAVVLGSGVYAGHWLAEAKGFADRHRAELRERPVWLFSSGPLGDPLQPSGDPVEVAPLTERLEAAGHRLFGGRLERAELNLAERAIVKLVRAPYGDYRSWPDVAEWARQIVGEL